MQSPLFVAIEVVEILVQKRILEETLGEHSQVAHGLLDIGQRLRYFARLHAHQ